MTRTRSRLSGTARAGGGSGPRHPAVEAAEPVAVAMIGSAVAPVRDEPRVASTQTTQVLAGHLVNVLVVRDDWLYVRTLDGYEGWMHRGYVREAAPIGVDELRPPVYDVTPRLSLGCTVRAANSRIALPLGAWVRDEAVESGEVIGLDEQAVRFPKSAAAIVETAVTWFEGTSYEWGGITPWGADCSGLVQASFGLHGVALPRDAWMQAGTGAPIAGGIEDTQAADLCFFSDREDEQITHVGIALGDRRMVHLALGRGGYRVEKLDDTNDRYVAALLDRFLFARRPEIAAHGLASTS